MLNRPLTLSHALLVSNDVYLTVFLLTLRNVLVGFGLLLATVQLLDFLSFHNLFGPWAVIIGKLMVDLGRFLVILAIFMFGFTMYVSAIYNPVRPIYSVTNNTNRVGSGYPPAGRVDTEMVSIE